MISANFLPLISFVLITSFTPGPANISSASMGVLHGYRKTLKFLFGLSSGFFIVMLLSGWVSGMLLKAFPGLETLLRYAGAAYILYLAFSILKASYTFKEGDQDAMGYAHGLMLQVLNPKLIVYALTLFASFLAPITGNAALVFLAVVLLAITAFCATSTWALFGSAIKNSLKSPRISLGINVLLALLLVYSAVELAGIL